MKTKISIPKPCSENWNNMTANSTGKHCSVCNKTVVDFTKMNDNEVMNYFIKHSNAKICGHFKKGQLNLNKNKTQEYFTDLYYNAYVKIKYKAPRILVLFVLSLILTMYGCNTPTQGELIEKQEMITGDSIAVSANIDSIKPKKN